MSTELDPKAIYIQDGSPWRRLPMIGFGLMLVGFIGAFALLPHDVQGLRKFWSSYLNGWMFALALGLGGAFFTLVQHVVRASWSVTVRRIAENMALTLPVTMLFGTLLLLGPDAHHGAEHGEGEVAHAEAKKPAGYGAECEYDNPEHPEPGTEKVGCKSGLICDPWTFTCTTPVNGLDADCSAGQECAGSLVCEEGKCVEHAPAAFPGSTHVFEWTHTEVVQEDPMLAAKSPYLNPTAAKIRYFAWFLPSFIFIGFVFWRWSTRQDTAADPEAYAKRMRYWSAIGIPVFAIGLTFTAFDNLMSLDPHWFSTMFGVYYFVGCALSVMSFIVLITLLLRRSGYLHGIVTNEHYHDLGKFMFGFTVFWAYIAFSQYFLIWYANIPEETHWFDYRGHGDWKTLSLALVFGRFVIPWFVLLRRPLKRNPNLLVFVAVWMLLMEFVEMFWLVQPAYSHHMASYYRALGDFESYHWYENHIDFAATDILFWVGFIGVFLAIFGRALNKYALVPVKDPRLPEAIRHENF